MIQVEGLTKYYGQFKAIDRLSFHAEAGEIVGFLGRNGAGKTTTMRILTGYMPATEGSATIAGYDIFEDSIKVRQHIGYLPETVPLYREMTVWQYIDYMASLRGMRRADRAEQVDEALDMVDMLDRADSMISSLSKGMRQRVGLAQAMVHQPEVLILDEPTIGLDPEQVIEVRELIRNLGQDRTVLLSSHNLDEVERLCTRILVIHEGRIVAEDTPASLAASMQGRNRFLVQVGNAEPEDVAAVLNDLENVLNAVVSSRGIEVESEQDQDARPAVAAAIVGRSWDLLELRPIQMQLEEIFLQLTMDEMEEVA
jgi:ABC-2 type transport system ATP-binding protein